MEKIIILLYLDPLPPGTRTVIDTFSSILVDCPFNSSWSTLVLFSTSVYLWWLSSGSTGKKSLLRWTNSDVDFWMGSTNPEKLDLFFLRPMPLGLLMSRQSSWKMIIMSENSNIWCCLYKLTGSQLLAATHALILAWIHSLFEMGK